MSSEIHRSYLDASALPFFFCPGCGHSAITRHLDSALALLQLDPHKVVIVTDIGCSGLTDKYFATHAFHGLHGRSITYATGIKLSNRELHVIVLMGDGGCGIGGHHLINAARRNIGITVVVFNNLNYGMTGGQHSISTPPGSLTGTTPWGHIERPMDICQTAAVNGAGFAARATSFDNDLPALLSQAIAHEGFSIVDVWELCTAYFAPHNRFGKNDLVKAMLELNMPPGVVQNSPRPEYSQAYRESNIGQAGKPVLAPLAIEPKYRSSLDAGLGIVLAGAAGTKINTAASALTRGALLSGLWATQRSDYPVTVKSGHSISEITVGPQQEGLRSLVCPEVMVVLFPEGLAAIRDRAANLSPHSRLYLHADLLPVDTPAHLVPLDFSAAGAWARKREYWAIMAAALLLKHEAIYPIEAFIESVASMGGYAKENSAAIAAALAL